MLNWKAEWDGSGMKSSNRRRRRRKKKQREASANWPKG